MLAPIFTWELQRTMQRRWFHAARLMFAAMLLLIFLWHLADLTTIFAHTDFRRSLHTVLGQTREFQHFLMLMHCALLFLLAPIFAAGPILQEKRQKTLELLLTTQQCSVDIIVGQWLAAVVKLLILATPAVPLLIWMHAFGAASPMAWIVAWIGCTWLLVLPLTAWPVLVAVYARQTATGLLFSYTGNALFVALLFQTFRDAQLSLWSYAIYDATFWLNFGLFVALPTVLCGSIAVWRLRPAFGAAPERESRSAANRPTLTVSDQPILWKQTHCNNMLMPRFLCWLPRWARVALSIAITIAIAMIPDRISGALMLMAISLAIPMIALIRASRIIGSEHEGRTWDNLRLTSLSAEEIVHDSLNAINSQLRLYWFALLPAIVLSACKGRENLSIVPIWLMAGGALSHASVAGIHASLQSRSSWGSLIYAIAAFCVNFIFTAVLSFVGAGSIVLLTSFVSCISCLGLLSIFELAGEYLAPIVVIVNGILFCVVFLTLLHIMLRNLSTLQIISTMGHLVKIDGFERAGPRSADRAEKLS